MKEIKLFAKILFGLALVSALFSNCSNTSHNISAGTMGVQTFTYTITFNANDGTENPATTTQTFTYPSLTPVTLKANTFSRSGYTFQGWAKSSISSSAEYSDGAAVSFTGNTTLYAIWKNGNASSYAYSYTITFHGNGGKTASGATTTTQLVQGNTQSINIKLNQNTFEKSGYTFLGWAYFNDASKINFVDGATYSCSSNLTLYALWKSDTYTYSYTITFDGNGGKTASGATTTTQMAEGNNRPVTITLDANPFSKDGCVFVGWSNINSPSMVYDDGATYSVYSNQTFTARWSEVANAPTLTLDANDGSGRTFTKTVSSGDKIFFNKDAIYNTFKRDNFQLVAFNENAAGTGTTYDYDGLNGAKYYIELTSNKTLYGVWKEYPHITFNANGGKASDNSTEARQYQQGKIDRSLYSWYFIPDNVASSAASETVALNENPFTRSGYVFKGWSENQSATSATYTDKQSVAAFINTAPNELTTNWNGKTLYAVWQKIPTITYNMNGGSNASSFSEDSVTITSTTPTAKYSYYTFQGWSASSAATSATYTAGNAYSGTENITLYAVWKLGTIVNGQAISVARGKTETIATFTLLKTESVSLTISNLEDKLEYIATPTSGSPVNFGKQNSATTVQKNLDAGTYTFTAKNNETIGSANTATVTLKGN